MVKKLELHGVIMFWWWIEHMNVKSYGQEAQVSIEKHANAWTTSTAKRQQIWASLVISLSYGGHKNICHNWNLRCVVAYYAEA